MLQTDSRGSMHGRDAGCAQSVQVSRVCLGRGDWAVLYIQPLYDLEIGRWINADSALNPESILGKNTFAYCINDIINLTDQTGNLPFFAITAAIGAS